MIRITATKVPTTLRGFAVAELAHRTFSSNKKNIQRGEKQARQGGCPFMT